LVSEVRLEEKELSLGILGCVRICASDGWNNVASEKVRSVLGLLAVRVGSVVSVDEFIDELWADGPPGNARNARNALQANITRLRRQLTTAKNCITTPVSIRTVGGGYLLDIPASAIDAHRFVDLIVSGSRMSLTTPEAALGVLRSGLDLWRGPALFDAGQGLRVHAAAAHLEEWRLTGWQELIIAQLVVGDVRSALSQLKLLASRYPNRERLTELLMAALYLSGRQTEAVQEFHRQRRYLDAELGIQPSPGLTAVYGQIIRGQTDVQVLLRRERPTGAAAIEVEPPPMIAGQQLVDAAVGATELAALKGCW
jgi:SARP family transcriptional regulator, regulator of embCAB operon